MELWSPTIAPATLHWWAPAPWSVMVRSTMTLLQSVSQPPPVSQSQVQAWSAPTPEQSSHVRPTLPGALVTWSGG